LAGVPHLLLPQGVEGLKRSWFVYVVQLDLPEPNDLRNRVMVRLRELGIECQAYFPAIHRQPYLVSQMADRLEPLAHTEMAADRCMALPFFPTITLEEISFVSETLKTILHEEISAQQTARGNLIRAAIG
jgi:dTDP-4-amino-4,6-dideoxygalactose transaminase